MILTCILRAMGMVQGLGMQGALGMGQKLDME